MYPAVVAIAATAPLRRHDADGVVATAPAVSAVVAPPTGDAAIVLMAGQRP